MAKVISFEGIDGSGKSTVIEQVKLQLESKGHSVLVLREPGTTNMGEAIRNLIKSDVPRDDATDLLLFMAARNDMVQKVLLPAQTLYDYILMDRFIDSTVAYQGYGMGRDIMLINTLNRYVTKGSNLDMTVYLDISVTESIKRRVDRNATDKYETKEMLKKVKAGYDAIITNNPDRFFVVKNNDLDTTVKKIVRKLTAKQADAPKRATLAKIDETAVLRGVVARPGKNKETGEPTLLLRSVKKKRGQKVLTDHTWIPYTRDVVKAGTLMPGDIIEFTATLSPYTKMFRGEVIDDCGLSNITDVTLVKEAPQPKSAIGDWERNDLSYIYSVDVEDLYNTLLTRYIGYASAMIYKHYNGGIDV